MYIRTYFVSSYVKYVRIVIFGAAAWQAGRQGNQSIIEHRRPMAHRMLDIARQRCHCVVPLCRWRQVPGVGIVRARHQTNGCNKTTNANGDESHLNWKERSEAPKWMQRIAPTRGGKLSELKWYEATAIAAGCAVFYWAWFVAEPPRPAVAVAQDADDGKSSR